MNHIQVWSRVKRVTSLHVEQNYTHYKQKVIFMNLMGTPGFKQLSLFFGLPCRYVCRY